MTTPDDGMSELDALRMRIQTGPNRPIDLLCEAVSDAVLDAVLSGSIVDRLMEKGWRLAYVGDRAGRPPEPPQDWMERGIDTLEPGWRDPLGRLTELWDEAWRAGFDAGRATSAGGDNDA